MTAPFALDSRHERLLQLLADNQVEFVVVGGVGLQFHGYDQPTQDLDISVVVSDSNNERIDRVLQAVNGRPLPMPGTLGTPFMTDAGKIEFLQDTSGVGRYPAWRENASAMTLPTGQLVFVGAANDIVRSKEAAGRPKDIDSLPDIRSQLLESGAITQDQVRGPVRTHDPSPPPRAKWAHIIGDQPPEGPKRAIWEFTEQMVDEHYKRWALDTDTPLAKIKPLSSDHVADLVSLRSQVGKMERMLARDRETGLDNGIGL